MSGWCGGLAEWVEGDTAYLSIAFTWLLPKAREHALWYRSMGLKVRAGGPATFRPTGYLVDVAQLGGAVPEAVTRHNPDATFASRGCPVDCSFCIVPKMEGLAFTLLPEFWPRPVLCDNNLSALPAHYQRFIIDKYKAFGMPLMDANSGFEPLTFDLGVFEAWNEINRGPWRFAFDEWKEWRQVYGVCRMLRKRGVSAKRIKVYVLIGNEPIHESLGRIRCVLEWGGEPHCQPYLKLNTLTGEPWVRHDWTAAKLKDMARWANRRIWRYATFAEYAGSIKSARTERYDRQTGLFA